MGPKIPGVFRLGSAFLAACGSNKGDTDSSSSSSDVIGTDTPQSSTPTGITTASFTVTAEWTDDGGSPADGFCGDTLHIVIVDPLGETEWQLGLTDRVWTGEGCGLTGEGCHPITVDHTLEQVPDCLTGSVVLGNTTFFDAADEDTTFYLADSTGSCFVWGLDVACYSSLGC